MSLSESEKATYLPIIDGILEASDLTTISEKRIRKGLQAAVDHDITPQKDAIKGLIMARFDKSMAESQKAKQPPETNGHAPSSQEGSAPPSETPKSDSPAVTKKHKHESDEEELSDVIDSPHPKKKRKVEQDSDAAYAAKLQAMENSRMRSTRGGGAKTSKPVKRKTPKKKSAGRVKAEDDSDIEASGSDVKERKINRNTGFHKELVLSAPLSQLLDNEVKLSRPQTVKKIWAYVREHELQDQKDKRWIICDDGLRAVFKQDKVHMFTMNKILNQNLYTPDE